MKLLITGASGLLGLNLALEAVSAHQVIGIDRGTLDSAPFEVIHSDLAARGAVEEILQSSKPDAVIHCAAAADVDSCEANPVLARTINAEVPKRIAVVCAAAGIRLVHISTDAVFDGKKAGCYEETDAPHAIGVYAATKLAAEDAVLRACPNALVMRVNFYGWSLSGRRSLAEFFVNNLAAGKPVRGFTDVVFCPMLVGHLSGILLEMLQSSLRGVYHAVGAQPMSKFQFGLAIARKFGFDDALIAPDIVDSSGLGAPRAHNLNLSTGRLCAALGHPIPDFSTGIDEFYRNYQQGYPQRIRTYQQASATAGLGAPDVALSAAGSVDGSRHGH